MSVFIHTDVTAVKLYQDLIYAGIGSSLSVFDRSSLKFLKRTNCLNGQKIYGIVPLSESAKTLVFGGKQFTVISMDLNTHEGAYKLCIDRLFDPMVCEDWLHSATWMDGNTVALLTAHNTVQIWNLTTQRVMRQHISSNNSILYSGLLLPLQDGLLVFAGTVFSEVIIHNPEDEKPLHHLKGHRGVIFSISCNSTKGIIVTTSDDRSVRIWGSPIKPNLLHDTCEYWKNIDIVCNHEVYGHTARVMRSTITNDMIISVGEDSAVCFWSYEGKLLKKKDTHQNSPIWSVDSSNSHLVTGGGDGAVIVHPLSMALDYGQKEPVILNTNTMMVPKKIAFTARHNLVILNDCDKGIHYFSTKSNCTTTHQINHGSTYKLLSLSSCKQLVAVADMSGKLDIFAENCKDDCLTQLIDTSLNVGNVLSMQWAGNRHIVLCGDKGNINVVSSENGNVDMYEDFILPPCKERWLTAAAMDVKNEILIVGDRCGNVHIYVKRQKNPVKTFNKVHGRYGPTSVTIKQDEFITTGRDGTIRYFSLNKNTTFLAKYMSSKYLEFQWVEKFIDKEENIICGFKERVFVVYNVQSNLKLMEVACGGGHRSWDVIRYISKLDEEYEEFIKLVYVKNNDICSHTLPLSQITSKNVINSTHSKEINCLKSFQTDLDRNVTFFITGGEDTTLRVSSIDADLRIRDEIISKHLSNVRTLKILDLEGSILVISAGGRAQIRIMLINISSTNKQLKVSSQELIDYLIKGTDKERKNNQTWRNNTIDFDPETRIMDVDILKQGERFLIFAGCSDACLRVFSFVYNTNNLTFEPVGELWHHKTCILKTTCVKFLNKDILITCTTRGEVCLWDVTDIVSWDGVNPFFSTRTNKCGINSIDTRVISEKLLIATGGDDNAIHLILLEVPDSNLSATYVKHKWCTDQFHCSQVTGLELVDDLLVSTSIDQRVTVARWRLEDRIKCEFQSQIFSDVADIQGMELLSTSSDNAITVCAFGKGLEVLRLPQTS